MSFLEPRARKELARIVVHYYDALEEIAAYLESVSDTPEYTRKYYLLTELEAGLVAIEDSVDVICDFLKREREDGFTLTEADSGKLGAAIATLGEALTRYGLFCEAVTPDE